MRDDGKTHDKRPALVLSKLDVEKIELLDGEMIDLHCHILPGLDDGAPTMAVALAMARMAVDDGIGTIACTPHILPGVYPNTASIVRAAVGELASALSEAAIPLHVITGADIHLDPGLLGDLEKGYVPTLGDTRYFLFEPPHHVAPPKLDEFAFRLVTAGFIPILTHPERLTWIDNQFDIIQRLSASGILMQLTAGSVLGRFGRRAQYWAERMLDEEMADLLASDAHNVDSRPPRMAAARDAVAARCGEGTALRLVATNPLAILNNVIPSQVRQSKTG
jgi:protein-tyrosine phosphatase